MADRPTLATALGAYPHTAPLRDGRVTSDRLTLDFADLPVISRAFAPMVRGGRYDVCEMAIATFLQARAYDKSLVLLPVVMAARFQEPALLTRSEGGVAGPADLAGRRVGVRAYGQTTAVWLRGILEEAHGVAPDAVRWVTFEDAHVAEFRDPPSCERAPAGSDMLAMLRDGALDAVIVGNDVPADPAFRTVFADPAAASASFRARHGFMPVNHLVVIKSALAESGLATELMRLFRAAADMACDASRPFTRAALHAPIALALRYATDQNLLPRSMSVADVWAGLPPEIA